MKNKIGQNLKWTISETYHNPWLSFSWTFLLILPDFLASAQIFVIHFKNSRLIYHETETKEKSNGNILGS